MLGLPIDYNQLQLGPFWWFDFGSVFWNLEDLKLDVRFANRLESTRVWPFWWFDFGSVSPRLTGSVLDLVQNWSYPDRSLNEACELHSYF